MEKDQVIIIGADHGGVDLKDKIKKHLEICGNKVLDLGTFRHDPADYPDIADLVCEKVLQDEKNIGILICGTGIGIGIAANKRKGIRAALCSDTYSARMAKAHNNANILTMGGRVLGEDLANDIVDAWLSENF